MRGKGIVEPDTGSVSWSGNQALSVVSEAIDACLWPLGAIPSVHLQMLEVLIWQVRMADVCGFSQIAQHPSFFDGCSRSQLTATHVFTENLKRIVDSDVFDRYSELSSYDGYSCSQPLVTHVFNENLKRIVDSELSSFDGCSCSQPLVTHVFSENLKRIVDSDGFDRSSKVCEWNVKPRCLAVGSNYESFVFLDMSQSPVGQPVFTSAVNVTVHVHPVGDGHNEPARFSKQAVGVDSWRASRNVRRRFTPTESVTQGSVGRGTQGQRRSASISNNGGMLQDSMPGCVNELSTTVEQHPGATHIIRNPGMTDRTCVPMSRIFDRFRSIGVGNTDMSERAIGQPASTSAVNVSVLVQPIGDGLNEHARFSEQGVDSGRASRNVRRRFTPTEPVTQGSVSRLSTGMLQDSMPGYVNELSTTVEQHPGATHII
ncbi:hypothetical protein Tco_0441845 [Tanacetum coccineum]